ncbi:hypothetical protein RIF29_17872 [Crotalaria pallida]|uniref:Uncharacterized protein n=1 Tax=Crotalaria pallida TaxID=3830 RepID=A0AAN9IEY2_CROPI
MPLGLRLELFISLLVQSLRVPQSFFFFFFFEDCSRRHRHDTPPPPRHAATANSSRHLLCRCRHPLCCYCRHRRPLPLPSQSRSPSLFVEVTICVFAITDILFGMPFSCIFTRWKKPICIGRHAFGDQYFATDTIINGPGSLSWYLFSPRRW